MLVIISSSEIKSMVHTILQIVLRFSAIWYSQQPWASEDYKITSMSDQEIKDYKALNLILFLILPSPKTGYTSSSSNIGQETPVSSPTEKATKIKEGSILSINSFLSSFAEIGDTSSSLTPENLISYSGFDISSGGLVPVKPISATNHTSSSSNAIRKATELKESYMSGQVFKNNNVSHPTDFKELFILCHLSENYFSTKEHTCSSNRNEQSS